MKPYPLYLLGAMLLSFTVNSQAQDAPSTSGTTKPHNKNHDASGTTQQPTTSGTTEHQRPHFIEQLGLTAAQTAQIAKIRKDMPQGTERRKAIEAVLTPAQLAQLKQDKAQWKAQHPKGKEQ